MRLAILSALLLAGCATAPAPEACNLWLAGNWDVAPKGAAFGPWWNANCAGRLGGGGSISDSEVAPLRFHYTPGGLQTY